MFSMDREIQAHLETLESHLRLSDHGINVIELFPVTGQDESFLNMFTEKCHDLCCEYGHVLDILISDDVCVITINIM